jgi:WD40 repeat protein
VPETFICSQGHRWEAAGAADGSAATCPICGAAPGSGPHGLTESLSDGDLQNTAAYLGQDSPGQDAAGKRTGVADQVGIPGYEILGVLGRGGMGVVYHARQTKLKRLVALKMILAGAHAGPQELERFRLEAEAIARLQHPNVVQIYEVGEHEGKPYFSLEFVDGGSLQNSLTGTPLPARDAARLVETLARAMEAAHQHGVIHRDLKPANVLLTKTGIPKITDFGLAKQLGQDSGQSHTGQIMGTPSYMAPEQAAGNVKAIGAAADIYALGAMLYEMLTGRPPFKAASVLDTLEQVRTQEPVPPSQLQPKTPRDLETICLQCLHKEPARRYASAAAVADELRRFQAGEPILARPIRRLERAWRWCRRNPALAAALGGVAATLLVAAVVSALFAVSEREARESADRSAADARESEGRAKTNETKAKESAAEARRQLERFEIANGLRLLDNHDLSGALLWLSAPLGREAPSDHERIHHHRLSLYWRYATRPALVQSLFQRDSHLLGVGLAIAGAGRHVIIASDEGTRAWDAVTGKPVSPVLTHRGRLGHAEFSADGRRVLIGVTDADIRADMPLDAEIGRGIGGISTITRYMIQVWDVAQGKAISPPLRHQAAFARARLSADGQRVLTVTAANAGLPGFGPERPEETVQVWDAATGQPIGASLTHKDRVTQAVFSPDGQKIMAISVRDGIRIWEAVTGKNVAAPLPRPGLTGQVAFSPDSRQLLVVDINESVWVCEVVTGKTSGPALKHQQKGTVTCAAFSPDGQLILTACDRTVYVWDANTRQLRPPPLLHDAEVRHAAFSPDGQRIVTSSADNTARVWDAQKGTLLAPVLRHDHAGDYPVLFSADSRHLVTVQYENPGAVEVRAWALNRTPPIRSLEGKPTAFYATFSPNSRQLLTVSLRVQHDGATARVWDASSGKALTAPIGPVTYGNGAMYAEFSPDGKRFLAGATPNSAQVWEVTTGKPASPPLTHQGAVMHAAFDPDGRGVVTASLDKTAQVWDAVTGQSLLRLQHEQAVLHAGFSPDGRIIVTAAEDDTARVWDPATGHQIGPPLLHKAPGKGLNWRLGMAHRRAHFSPNGKYLVTTAEVASAQVWDLAAGLPRCEPRKHLGSVYRAAFSPDSLRVVTASTDHTARVWDVATGKPLTPPLADAGPIFDAGFDATGRLVLTVGSTVRIWDAESGQPISPPLDGIGARASLSPDGRQLVIVSGHSGEVRLYDVSLDDRPAADWVALGQLLDGRRLDRHGALEPLSLARRQAIWHDLRGRHPHDFAGAAE